MAEVLLGLKNISKQYYGNTVLSNINIEVSRGEIHALIGENGAGKSTLMNILFGMPVIHTTGGFDGTIEIDGKAVEIKSPYQAMQHGIGMVHQEFMLIPGFTITENIKLNREITRKNLVSRVFGSSLDTLEIDAMRQDARKALDTLDMSVDENLQVAGLPVGYMQFIEIAREIDKQGIKILVFDEPTAVLTESEAQNLLKAIRRLAAKGIGILFISHRLSEITDVADKVTILRDGEHVITKNTKDTNIIEIAEYMVGRKVSLGTKEQTATGDAKSLLQIKDLHVNMPGERVKGIDLDIKQGEILGIGGLAGQGKLGIANGIMGIYPARGEVLLNGQPLDINNPRAVITAGVGFVSEDRKGVGLLLNESIALNIAFTGMQINGAFLHTWGPFNLQNTKAMRDHANKMIKDLDIRCTGSKQHVGRLSGGNQQKVCVARALTLNPKLLFVSEPTRGIDIGAKKLVLDLFVKLNKEMGMTIVVTSSELAELKTICDRIAIICEGQVSGILAPTDSDVNFGLLMSSEKQLLKEAK